MVSAKKRVSPPIGWGLGLAGRDSFKTVKVILLGQPGVGKSGERSTTRRRLLSRDAKVI